MRGRRLAVVASVVAAALVGPAGSTSAVAHGSTGSRTAMTGDTYEAKVESYVNQRRARQGLAPLRSEACADRTAERWAAWLAPMVTRSGSSCEPSWGRRRRRG